MPPRGAPAAVNMVYVPVPIGWVSVDQPNSDV